MSGSISANIKKATLDFVSEIQTFLCIICTEFKFDFNFSCKSEVFWLKSPVLIITQTIKCSFYTLTG